MAQTQEKLGISAISVWQPHSSFIILGHKRHETRSQYFSHRGLLAIHASKQWSDSEKEVAAALHRKFPAIPLIENPPLGVMLGICRMLNCVKTESLSHAINAHERAVGGWSEGRWALELEVLEVFDKPIRTSGERGIYQWQLPEGFLEKRIAIVGSRDYQDLDAVKRYVYSLPKDVTIISGGARGVDTVAVDAAKERGMRTVVIPVNQRGLPDGGIERTNVFAQRAMIRNGEIVQMAGSVIGFWDGSSKGTANTLERAEKAGKTVLINPNTVIPEATAKQLSLEGFTHHYDESSVLTYSKIGHGLPDKKKETPPFQWEWPWLATKTDVWAKAEGSSYKLIPKVSKEAAAWGRILSGWLYSSETLALREWLKANSEVKENFIPLPCDYFDLNRYAIDDVLHAVKESDVQVRVIPVEKLTFTQETYNPGICLKYLEAGTVKEFDSDTLPMVYQFKGDERYFATNGAHRGIGWLVGLDPNWRAAMPVRFCYIPHSLESLYEHAVEVDEKDTETLEFLADVLAEAIQIIQEGKLVPA